MNLQLTSVQKSYLRNELNNLQIIHDDVWEYLQENGMDTSKIYGLQLLIENMEEKI
jgi:hypothetical protein